MIGEKLQAVAAANWSSKSCYEELPFSSSPYACVYVCVYRVRKTLQVDGHLKNVKDSLGKVHQ